MMSWSIHSMSTQYEHFFMECYDKTSDSTIEICSRAAGSSARTRRSGGVREHSTITITITITGGAGARGGRRMVPGPAPAQHSAPCR